MGGTLAGAPRLPTVGLEERRLRAVGTKRAPRLHHLLCCGPSCAAPSIPVGLGWGQPQVWWGRRVSPPATYFWQSSRLIPLAAVLGSPGAAGGLVLDPGEK